MAKLSNKRVMWNYELSKELFVQRRTTLLALQSTVGLSHLDRWYEEGKTVEWILTVFTDTRIAWEESLCSALLEQHKINLERFRSIVGDAKITEFYFAGRTPQAVCDLFSFFVTE